MCVAAAAAAAAVGTDYTVDSGIFAVGFVDDGRILDAAAAVAAAVGIDEFFVAVASNAVGDSSTPASLVDICLLPFVVLVPFFVPIECVVLRRSEFSLPVSVPVLAPFLAASVLVRVVFGSVLLL